MKVSILEEFIDHTLLGMPVRIRNGVVETEIDGETCQAIVKSEELAAAVMLARLKSSMRLSGAEWRAVRKALGMTQAEYATLVRASREAVSRWEAGAAIMGEQTEIAVRLTVASMLLKRAPAMDLDVAALTQMRLVDPPKSIWPDAPVFELVTLKSAETRAKEKHWDEYTAAA